MKIQVLTTTTEQNGPYLLTKHVFKVHIHLANKFAEEYFIETAKKEFKETECFVILTRDRDYFPCWCKSITFSKETKSIEQNLLK